MTLKTWLLFLAMETALSLSPGPAVFYTVAQGVRGALRRTLPAAAGILTANGIYFALSATSLGAIIAASARFFTIAKRVGAAYLIYLGIKALRSANSMHAVTLGGDPAEKERDLRSVYLGALTLQLANPKALLFFLALLPQFIDPAIPVVPQMLILAATSMLPEFCILTGYGWLAHRAVHATARFGVTGNMNRLLARIEGIGLLACATLVLKFNRGWGRMCRNKGEFMRLVVAIAMLGIGVGTSKNGGGRRTGSAGAPLSRSRDIAGRRTRRLGRGRFFQERRSAHGPRSGDPTGAIRRQRNYCTDALRARAAMLAGFPHLESPTASS